MGELLTIIKKIDINILYFFNVYAKNPFTDIVMPFLSSYGYLLFLPLIFISFYTKERKLNFLIFVFFTFVFADFLSNTLKNLIMRPRPYLEFLLINMEGRGGSFSMPSNHATNAFAIAFFLKKYNKNFFIPLIFATLIAISRVFVGVHYPTDILVGGILGSFIGIFVNQLYQKFLILSSEKPYKGILIIVLMFISILRILFIKYSPIDLSGDEAHYWEWSRHLDMSYYSKGPLIAYTIFLGTKIFGHTELGVRFFAVFFSFFSSLLMYEIAYLLIKNDKKSFISGLSIQLIPFFSYLGILMTIDSPLLYFWLLAMYIVCKMFKQNDFFDIKNWIYLGIVIGLGMLAKYTMIFFYPSLILFLFWEKRFIDFKKPGIYLSFFFTFLIFLPVILWNHTHSWVTLKHTAYHARLEKGVSISIKDFIDFIFSQIGLVTPFLFILMFFSFKKIKDFEKRFIFSFFWPVFIFFFLKSLQGRVEPNWSLIAYPSGLLSVIFLKDRAYKFAIYSYIFAGIITFLGYLTPYLNLPKNYNPSHRILGWERVGKLIDNAKLSMGNLENTIIFTDDYQLSSLISFYTKEKPFVFCVNFSGRRMNQYDIWAYEKNFDINNYLGKNAIFVTKNDYPFYENLIKVGCNSYEKKHEIVYNKQTKIRDIYIYKCFNLKKVLQAPIRSY